MVSHSLKAAQILNYYTIVIMDFGLRFKLLHSIRCILSCEYRRSNSS